MNALTPLRIAVLAPVQPRRACAHLAAHRGAGWIFAAAGAAQVLLAVVQWNVVSPVLARDPLFADWSAPGFAGGLPAAWAALAAPAALLIRAAVLGTVLHAAARTQASPWAAWVAWAVCADGVLWIESAAATAVAHWAQPADLAALRAARLHAGLDLVWPDAAWLGTLNVFTVWWTALLAAGMSWLGRTSRRRAVTTALACAACRAVAHALWNSW